MAAHGERAGDSICMWRRMRLSMVAGLLSFSHESSSNTSVWLVSLGEGLICTNLKSGGTNCLACGS